MTEAKAGAAGVVFDSLIDLTCSKVAGFHRYSCFADSAKHHDIKTYH